MSGVYRFGPNHVVEWQMLVYSFQHWRKNLSEVSMRLLVPLSARLQSELSLDTEDNWISNVRGVTFRAEPCCRVANARIQFSALAQASQLYAVIELYRQ
jgi:hypothetical protein